jgi:hypothetical protein
MKKTLLVLGILTVVFYGCKDEDVISQNDLASTQASQDHLFAEQTFNDVGRIVKEGFLSSGINKSCAAYQLMNADTANADTLIINFGTTNCLHNAKLRKGKLIITYTGKYRDSLAVMTTTFDNYYVNNNLVQGERIVANQGRNNKGNMWFTIEVNNASIATNNGTINWNATQTREWVSGNTTYYDISDDQYKITGTASGNAANGNAFTMEITDTLNVDLGCLPSCVIKSGKAKITPNGYTDRIINYGDSLCDCNFDITINGSTYPIVVN